MIALLANVVIAIAKLFAGIASGSTAMLAEAAHSAADSANEVFLAIGLHRERAPGRCDTPVHFLRTSNVDAEANSETSEENRLTAAVRRHTVAEARADAVKLRLKTKNGDDILEQKRLEKHRVAIGYSDNEIPCNVCMVLQYSAPIIVVFQFFKC